jgi:ribonuclease I
MRELDTYWPSYDGTNSEFWSHGAWGAPLPPPRPSHAVAHAGVSHARGLGAASRFAPVPPCACAPCPLTEWSKHGTCAEQLSPLSSQLAFFKGALTLAMRYNPVTILAGQGITPGGSVQASDVQNAMSDFGGSVSLSCSGGQLSGMGLCFDNSLSPVACPSNVENTCGDSFQYPAASQ